MANEPGAPFLPSGIVVGVLKHGQPGPDSIGCVMLTTIGAAPQISVGTSAMAVAFVCTVTTENPKSFENMPSAVVVLSTVMAELGPYGEETVKVAPATPPLSEA